MNETERPAAAQAAADRWLQRWLPLLAGRAGGHPVLEIGCGKGDDTQTLVAAGLDVHAFDLSPSAVEAARLRAPGAAIECRDLRAPWPLGEGRAGAIVASLSLHYFPWDETAELAARLRAALRPGGILLCRLNAADDHHFGASGHPAIAPGYFLVDGQPKRFFDAAAIDRLFHAGWQVLSRAHMHTHKYVQPKAIWEMVLERSGA